MTSVHSVGPSMQVYSTEVTSFSLPYAFLFIFGTAGNVAVLTYVFLTSKRVRRLAPNREYVGEVITFAEAKPKPTHKIPIQSFDGNHKARQQIPGDRRHKPRK
ncbi:unnamed protein product, partial [Mesorhabditis belari]|uniref:Uncharacterized protein n=1 Tax=Mesorhabditis belari TaxID=2138241 RepID=A0AAF3EBU2_9BILA